MFARLLSADFPTHRRDGDQIAKLLEAKVLPAVAKEQGFKGITFFFDKTNGKLMSITLYDTAANMAKAHDDIKDFRAGILQELAGSHLTSESFEIIASRSA